jgi:phosphatidylserine decarboxylase precursor-related protein
LTVAGVGTLAVLITLALAMPLAWKWQLGLRRCALWLTLIAGASGALVSLVGAATGLFPVLQVAAAVVSAMVISVAFLAYRFYRDPDRRCPALPGAILSPADGTVVYVKRSPVGSLPESQKRGHRYELSELARTPLGSGETIVVGIAMSFLDVHVNRAPIGGRVVQRTHVRGGFRSLRHPDAVSTNERATTLIERDGFQVAVVQIASRLVRQIVGFVRVGDTLAVGQRLGVIRFGSQVDIVMPAHDDLQIAVRSGDRVRAGESVLGFVDAERAAAAASQIGAVVIGSDFRGLGVVRSLGRRGIPTVVIDSEPRSAWFSRYASRRLRWDGSMGGPEFTDFLIAAAQAFGLYRWMLLPLQDEVVELVAREHEKLSAVFTLVTPPWPVARWVLDKRLLHQLAEETGVPHPHSWSLDGRAQDDLGISFPAVVKPRMSARLQHSHRRKAIAVRSSGELAAAIRSLEGTVPLRELIVQEYIPGAGESQFSVAALCRDGSLVCAMTARRRRQYPIDFGMSSCFVESIDVPALLDPARRLVRALGLSGLVEIEFKRDHRDGQFKLLDINIRPWGWHTLGAACGLDFAYLAFLEAIGDRVKTSPPVYGARWRRLLTDLPAAAREIEAGILSPIGYLRSFRGTTVPSVFDLSDPLPALGDVVSAIVRLARFRLRGSSAAAGHEADGPSGSRVTAAPAAASQPRHGEKA